MKERQFNPPQGSLDSKASLTLSSVGSEWTYFAPFNGREAPDYLADTQRPRFTVKSKLKSSQVKT